MDMTFILYSIGVFLVIVLVLVIILLVAKKYLSPSGNVTITINGKDKLEVEQGSSLLSTLPRRNSPLPDSPRRLNWSSAFWKPALCGVSLNLREIKVR